MPEPAAVAQRWVSRGRQICYFKSKRACRFLRRHREIVVFDCFPESSIMSLAGGRNRRGGLKHSDQNRAEAESALCESHTVNMSSVLPASQFTILISACCGSIVTANVAVQTKTTKAQKTCRIEWLCY
jgi:hypothetical protein